MEERTRRRDGRLLAEAALCAAMVWAVGCGGQPATLAEVDCPASQPDAQPRFDTVEEARNHFAQLADEAHRAMLRHEHALRALRNDRRWDEPDQRIWLSIATTETLTAIEENRLNEKRAQQQLQLLAQR